MVACGSDCRRVVHFVASRTGLCILSGNNLDCEGPRDTEIGRAVHREAAEVGDLRFILPFNGDRFCKSMRGSGVGEYADSNSSPRKRMFVLSMRIRSPG